MKVTMRASILGDTVERRHAVLGTLLVTTGAAVGATLYTVEPRALALAVALVAGVAAVRATYLYPGVLLAAFLCTPFYKAGIQHLLPGDLTVILAVLNILQIPIFLNSRGPAGFRSLRSRRVRYAILLWSSITALVVFGVLRAPNTDAAMAAASNWIILTYLPSFAVLRVASERRYLRQLMWGLFIIGAVVVIAGLWILPQVGEWPNDRLRVFGAHTIRVGQAALLVPLIAVPFVLKTSPTSIRLMCTALIPPSLLVAASSGSRGPLLFLVLTGLIFAVRRLGIWTRSLRHQPPKIRPLRLIIPGAFLMLLLVAPLQGLSGLIPETSAQRLGTLSTILGGLGGRELAEDAPDGSTADRLFAYDLAERMFFDKPFIGHGTYSFATQVYRHEVRLVWPEATAHPHNLVLQIAAEHGILGIFILSALVGTALWRGLRLTSIPEWNAIAILCLFFLLCAMVSTEMLDNRMLWNLLFLMLLAADPEAGDRQTKPVVADYNKTLVAAKRPTAPLPTK